jgi:RNA polymerase sigma-70 factor (ECF subfamily)
MQHPADNSSDQDLIASINRGEDDAFEVLYHRYRDWVVQLAWRFTGHHDDALDVLQETFTYVVRKFPGFELTASMTTFLYPAVRNLSIAARKKRRRAVSSPELLSEVADGHPSTAPEADAAHESTELAQVLQALSALHREVLLMRFVDGMTQQEIADALALPLGTVKSRLHHAIAAIRKSPAVMQYLGTDVPQIGQNNR